MDFYASLQPAIQALIAGVFTWFCTMVGAATVLFVREVNDRFLAIMQGFAAGVMIAASFWSLLEPALDYAQAGPIPSWFPVAIGFLVGGLFLRLLDVLVPHIHLAEDHNDAGVNRKKFSRTTMLFLAVTIHNIPEGLALGVAFAAASLGGQATLTGALALTIGIGLQNIPEGSALSLPLFAEGRSKGRAFNLGHGSAIVEPISAVIGAVAVLIVTSILPYALSFAAGAMIFVVVEELIPEAQSSNHTDIATMALMFGFILMMILDVALG